MKPQEFEDLPDELREDATRLMLVFERLDRQAGYRDSQLVQSTVQLVARHAREHGCLPSGRQMITIVGSKEEDGGIPFRTQQIDFDAVHAQVLLEYLWIDEAERFRTAYYESMCEKLIRIGSGSGTELIRVDGRCVTLKIILRHTVLFSPVSCRNVVSNLLRYWRKTIDEQREFRVFVETYTQCHQDYELIAYLRGTWEQLEFDGVESISGFDEILDRVPGFRQPR